MNNICVAVIIVVVVLLSITVISRYQNTKSNFINGMWSNSDDNIYLYIDDKVKDDGWKGGYLVSTKHDVNEPFKIKTEVGIGDAVKIDTKKSKFLAKSMVSKLKLDDGIIEVTDKDKKKYKLYKDTETTKSMKS